MLDTDVVLFISFAIWRESSERLPYGPPPGKYPPTSTDGAESKPNIDGLISHLPPHSSAVPMLIGPTGLPAHPIPLSHLPPNHPSLVTSPQIAVPPNSSSIQGKLWQNVANSQFFNRIAFICDFSTTIELAGLISQFDSSFKHIDCSASNTASSANRYIWLTSPVSIISFWISSKLLRMSYNQ